VCVCDMVEQCTLEELSVVVVSLILLLMSSDPLKKLTLASSDLQQTKRQLA